MKIEKQVVNLELSKKLKELGYSQEGIWWWFPYYNKNGKISSWDIAHRNGASLNGALGLTANQLRDCIVAPTCAEMAEALPPQMFDRILEMAPYCKDWTVRYCHYYAKPPVHHDSQQYADTLANAMAECWIFLKEKELL